MGTNLGNRERNIDRTLLLLKEKVGPIVNQSQIYQTAAWGHENQSPFLNIVVEISTTVSPETLLGQINKIENDLGRIRKEKWKERVIDIDILYYHSLVVNNDLKVPHPEIPNRRFALIPLVEIAPFFIHPVLLKTQQQLLAECKDELDVEKFMQSDTI